MVPTVDVPIDEGFLLALDVINLYWGFKYPDAMSMLLTLQICQGKDFPVPNVVPIEAINELASTDFILQIDDETAERFIINVLWLNANLNGKTHTFLNNIDQVQGKWSGRTHRGDNLKLYNHAKSSQAGQPVKIAFGNGTPVIIDNKDNWFTDYCISLVGRFPPGFDCQAELRRLTFNKTSTKENDDKWGAMYGTYLFLKETGNVQRRTEAFWEITIDYLYLLGFESEPYSTSDKRRIATFNSKISTYNKYLLRGKGYVIPRDSYIQPPSLLYKELKYMKNK